MIQPDHNIIGLMGSNRRWFRIRRFGLLIIRFFTFWNQLYMRQHIIVVALVAAAALIACGTDKRITTTSEGTMTTASTYDEQATGTISVRLELIQGFFIEGFEIGLRFETTEGKVIATTLWSDFVRSQGNPQLKTYYDSVLKQSVPAGDIVVFATVNVGIGTPPEIPDRYGDMRCRLQVQVPDNGMVEVELSFSDRNDCLQLF